MHELPLMLEKLQWYRKKVNQVFLKPGMALYNGSTHIRNQLSQWLEEEIYFLEKKHQMAFIVPLQKTNSNNTDPIATTLSVPQLALIIRLYKDTGVIKVTNQTQLMEKVARNFRTVAAATLAAGSINAKSYAPEMATVKKLKDVLINLMNQLRKIETGLR